LVVVSKAPPTDLEVTMNERTELLERLGFERIRDGYPGESVLEFSVVTSTEVAEIIASVETDFTRFEVRPERMGEYWAVEVSHGAPSFALRRVAEAAMATIGA
jgi:hypothetical protein